jgi:hypothetical protein
MATKVPAKKKTEVKKTKPAPAAESKKSAPAALRSAKSGSRRFPLPSSAWSANPRLSCWKRLRRKKIAISFLFRLVPRHGFALFPLHVRGFVKPQSKIILPAVSSIWGGRSSAHAE